MPRVAIKKKDYMKKDLCQMIAGKMYGRFLQREVAKELGLTQQAFSYKLRNCVFDYKELLVIFQLLDFSDDEILKNMKMGGTS